MEVVMRSGVAQKSHGQTPLLSLRVQLDNFELSWDSEWISNLISHVGIARPNAVQHGHQVEELQMQYTKNICKIKHEDMHGR